MERGAAYGGEAVRAADEAAVGQLAGALLVVAAAAAAAGRDEALSEVPPARHGDAASRLRSGERPSGAVAGKGAMTKTTATSMRMVRAVAGGGCRGRWETCCFYAAADGGL